MKPVKLAGFTGINNIAPTDRLPKDDAGRSAVRDAVNVDLTAAGSFQRRPGTDKIISGANCRSLRTSGGVAYYADGAKLKRFNGLTSADVADLATASARVAYADTPLGVAWSDGYSLNLITGFASRQMVPDAPNPMPVIAADGGGSLLAGSYGVCVASERSDGVRSELSVPVRLSVSASGRISLILLAQPHNVAVFVTACDGDVFYRAATIPVGATSCTIPVVNSDGEPIVWASMGRLPAGQVLAYSNGRLFSASGSMVCHSMPYSLGLYRPAADYLFLHEHCTMLAPVEGGMYLATARKTWFLPGDVADTRMVEIAPYGAIHGTLTTLPNSTDVMWFTDRGPVRASVSGEIGLLQDSRIAFDAGSESGASVVRESNGLRQLLTALSGSSPKGSAVAGSYMDAEVINP